MFATKISDGVLSMSKLDDDSLREDVLDAFKWIFINIHRSFGYKGLELCVKAYRKQSGEICLFVIRLRWIVANMEDIRVEWNKGGIFTTTAQHKPIASTGLGQDACLWIPLIQRELKNRKKRTYSVHFHNCTGMLTIQFCPTCRYTRYLKLLSAPHSIAQCCNVKPSVELSIIRVQVNLDHIRYIECSFGAIAYSNNLEVPSVDDDERNIVINCFGPYLRVQHKGRMNKLQVHSLVV